MWPFRKRPPPDPWDLATPLLKLSRNDFWRIIDAYMGMLVTGATGAGKTSSIGAATALAMLKQGFGGLVLCAKPGEMDLWTGYLRQRGRLDDAIIVDGSAAQRLNFLRQEQVRAGPGGGLTENILGLLTVIMETAERGSGESGKDSEPYWKRALRQMIRNALDLMILAKREVSVPNLYRLVITAAGSVEERDSQHWRSSSFQFECLTVADSEVSSGRDRHDYALVADYWCVEFPKLSEKTRSVIVSTFTSLVDVLNRSLLRELFSTDTTFRLEDTFEGKIVIVNLPIKEFSEIGQFAAVTLKHLFQKAVERRDVAVHPRPVFLWADEFQHFLTTYDSEFQGTARSSRVATVYLTQSVPSLRTALGGSDAADRVDALTANLQTKVWCANSDYSTNEWSAKTIGRSSRFFLNCSTSGTGSSGLPGMFDDQQMSSGFSEQLEFVLPPEHFGTLRRGGPENQWMVDTVFFEGGRKFKANGKCWLPVSFRQQF